ncbi:LysR family transcriptional regulator [Stenotrophomonas sp. HITSZ_GD]|uniref:LysR family transcriptional regulator n=1 Tax=Stenotrophomonas sp. HITSZ_GD TaxID=3037248 RepID=UPI00240E6D32|nr:LysR family transcriptional regulator [Stenotrophomonas sp. HITSZ_GD]MDG2524245.1 LysR family transcriptional regulator [Stenotrophomonas sp. HITSZ_GD]
MTHVSLSDLKAFALVARHRSFQKAVDTLGVSRSSLSHALKGLERQLGVRLLHRTTRSVSVTADGEQLLQRLGPLLRELDDLLDAVSHGQDEPVGLLRINANKGGARWLLRHAVPVFQQRHPRVELDLVAEGQLVDIVGEGFDAGVRLAESVPKDMVSVPFGSDVRFVAVAAPGYLAAFGTPAVPGDLMSHRCIRQRLPSGKRYRWEFEQGTRQLALDVPGLLSLDDNDLMVEAACSGLGIAYVPESFARPALDSGALVLLLEDWTPPSPGLCLYYASYRHVPAPLKAFIAVVREVSQGSGPPTGRDRAGS